MELKTFVSQALSEIVSGILDAQESLGSNGAHINPRLSNHVGDLRHNRILVSADDQVVQQVEFDIAVTAVEATGTRGGIGVIAGVVW